MRERQEEEREVERHRGMCREERDRESNGPYFLDGGARIYSALSLYFFSPGNSESIKHLSRCWAPKSAPIKSK